jgi:hypothetical protein
MSSISEYSAAGPFYELGHNLSGEEVEGAAGLVGGQHRSQRNWPGDRGHNIASRKIRAALAAAGCYRPFIYSTVLPAVGEPYER